MIKLKKFDSYSYIADKDFKLVSISEELKINKPDIKLGDVCYKVLGNSNTPCRICPILNKLSSVKYSYNKNINRWFNLSCAKINYENHGECYTIICDMIDDTINDGILNLTDYNSYDKIYEVDIVNNKYRIIVDKYGLPLDRIGNYSELVDIYLTKLISKKDRKRFKELMTINLVEQKVSSSINFALKDRFSIINEDEKDLQVQLVSIEKDSKGNLIKFLCLLKYVNENYNNTMYFNTDKLTGLTRGNDYYSLVEKLLNSYPDVEFAMVSIDIEHFKMFNEWYGFKEGDKFLVEIGSKLNEIDKSINSISGYFGDDNFCIVLPNKEQNYRLVELRLSEYIKKHGNGVSFLPNFGVYIINNRELSTSQMYDRALLANNYSKGNFSSRFSYYNDEMLVKLENEQVIQQEVKKGMMNNEFTFFVQPQYNINNDKIIACEALVRWISKDNGVIPAYKFIPVLEKTGFIVEIDKFIWEEVFKWLKNLSDKGFTPIPVSVNVSRIDLYYLDVASIFCGLIDKYKIDPELVEIEITESAYIESFEKIKDTLNRLQTVGFKIVMDDFGSGYSSLNMLKNVDVDILKLDMKFLQLNKESQKGVNILESIINMIKIINIPVICEGVETLEQKELLKDMGCIYAQGYLFNRPMPKESLEKLIINKDNIDYSGIHIQRNDKLHIQEFNDGSLFTETSLNNILGAIAFITVLNNNIEIQRVNEQFYNLFGTQSYTDIEFKTNFLKYIYKEDHKLLFECFNEAYNHQLQSKFCEIRYLDNNEILWLRIKVNFLNQNNNKKTYYVNFEDISEEKKNESDIYLLNQILKTTVKLGGINCFEWNVINNDLKIFTPVTKLPLYGENFVHTNSYVLVNNFPSSIVNSKIMGKYYKLVSNYIERILASNTNNEYRFEMPFTYQGGYLWYQIKGKGVYDEYNRLVAFGGTYVDITKIVYNRLEEREKIRTLNFLNEKALYSMDINLDHDTIYNIYGEFDERNSALKDVKEYDHLIKALAMYWLHPEDKFNFINAFSKNALIEAFNKHKSFISMDVRTLETSQPKWLKISVYLRKIENDIIAYMFCTDVDKYYKNETYNLNSFIDNENYGVINIKLSSYKVINANLLAAKIHNYNDIDDLLSRVHNGIVDSVFLHDKNQIAEKLAKLKYPGDHQTIEYRLLLPDGKFKYITCNAVVQKHLDKKFIQMLTFDNTAQKTLELNLLYEDSLKELRSLNTSNENKAFFVGINKVYESIYFINVNLNTYIAIKNPKELNPYVAISHDCDELLKSYVKDFVIDADIDKVLLMSTREYLSTHLTKNNEKVVITFRRKTSEGYNWFKFEFVASTFDMYGNLENVILLVSNIHDEMKLITSYKDSMEQYKELFINSTSQIYTDMIFINLETYNAVKAMFKDNSVVEESFNRSWDKVYKDLLKIVSDEYVNVIKDNLSIESLHKLKYGEKKSFRYSTKSKNNARWFTSSVHLIELKGVKHAVVFSMDITKDFNELLFARRNSEYDGLTMLYNRRKLTSFLDNEYTKLSSCGVIFFDINGLKDVNDHYGHQAGDIIIKIAADSIKAVEDKNIHGFRYGGDEFLVVVCDESKAFVNDTVTKIKENIENQNMNSNFKCKISIGVSYSEERADVEELISIADALMYKEKNATNIFSPITNINEKNSSLLKFLASEYDAIYELNLVNDSYKLLESSRSMLLNEIPLQGSYNNFVTNYFNKYSHTNEGLNVFLIDSLNEKLKEKESISFTPETIYGPIINIGYRCMEYDDNGNPVIVILTIKF